MATNYFYYENKNASINREIQLNDEQKFWKDHTYRRFSLMKQSRAANNLENNWNKWDRQYDAWRPPKGSSWQSTIVPPYTTSVVEAAMSEIIDQTLQPMVSARRPEFRAAATVMNYIKDYTWDIGYGDYELYKACKQLLKRGTTIWSDYYWRDQRQVKLIVGYDPKTGGDKYQEVMINDYDDCYGEAVDLFDVWFDPDARTVNTGPYKAQDAIRQTIMHIDTFRQRFVKSKWDVFGLAGRIKPGGDTNYYQYYQPPKGMDSGSYVQVLKHDIRNPDRMILTANDVPFYIGPNPYNHKQLPYATSQDIVNEWGIYGKGEPGLLESIQDELTTMRRMRIDRQHLDLYKMVFVSNREAISDNDLIPAPMKPVYVDDVNNIKFGDYGDINPSAYREEVLLKEDGARVTGIDDRAQSVAKPTATATDAAIMKEATLKRLRMKIWVLSRTLLTEQIKLRVPNIIQYYRTPKVIEIMGNSAREKLIKIREVNEQKRLLQDGPKYYEMEFRTITTKNKQLERNEDGSVKVVDKRGDNFFMVTPDLLPASTQCFNYKLSAEPTFPLSKPLQLQKTSEYMQHPVIMAAFQSGYYDIKKAADILTEQNDFNPEDMQSMNQEEAMRATMVDPQQMLELASRENDKMMKGEPMEVGTPFATPEHTQVHLAFMGSTQFKSNATPEIIKVMASHVMYENQAQILRQKALGQPMGPQQQQQPPGSLRDAETEGIMQGEMKQLLPGQQVGPENVPDLMGRSMGG